MRLILARSLGAGRVRAMPLERMNGVHAIRSVPRGELRHQRAADIRVNLKDLLAVLLIRAFYLSEAAAPNPASSHELQIPPPLPWTNAKLQVFVSRISSLTLGVMLVNGNSVSE